MASGYRRPLPAFLPEQLRALISECWAQDMRERPSMAQVLERLREIEASRVLDKKDSKKEAKAKDAKASDGDKKPKKWHHFFS